MARITYWQPAKFREAKQMGKAWLNIIYFSFLFVLLSSVGLIGLVYIPTLKYYILYFAGAFMSGLVLGAGFSDFWRQGLAAFFRWRDQVFTIICDRTRGIWR